MLGILLSGNYDAATIVIEIFALLAILLVAFPVHECAHGFVAKLLGDRTAEESGRLTLNPISHLDPFGSIGLLLFGIGWAKPVPINPNRCTKVKSGKAAMAITAAAGPISNILMSFILMIIWKVIMYAGAGSIAEGNMTLLYVITAINEVVNINLYLAVFNLIPIPPFDGSRIFFAFLPTKYYFKIMKYEQFIMIGILIVLWTGILDMPLQFLTNGLYSFLNMCTDFVGAIMG